MKWKYVVITITAMLCMLYATSSAYARGNIFKTICKTETTGNYPSPVRMDPIVYPGQFPAGHYHEIFGNTTINPSSTGQQLLNDGNAIHDTCDDRFDTSNYWVPELLRDGVRVVPRLVDVYYVRIVGLKDSTGQTLTKVTEPPVGFRIIAGNHDATTPQSMISWHCRGVLRSSYKVPPTCSKSMGEGLGVNITFPNCWDGGSDLLSNNSNNVVYMKQSNNVRQCPAGHDVQVPRLGVEVLYDNPTLPDCHLVSTPVDGQNCYVYTLSEVNAMGQPDDQGPVYGMHADFFDAWSDVQDTTDNPPLDFKSMLDKFLNAPDGASNSTCVEDCTRTNPTGDASGMK
jgi:hypothetical protein